MIPQISYFARSWIIQETIMAKQCWVIGDDGCFSWNGISTNNSCLQMNPFRLDLELPSILPMLKKDTKNPENDPA